MILIGIILYVVSRIQESSVDYLLAGRDTKWIAIVTSIFASNRGSEHLIGLAGTDASSGMAMAAKSIEPDSNC